MNGIAKRAACRWVAIALSVVMAYPSTLASADTPKTSQDKLEAAEAYLSEFSSSEISGTRVIRAAIAEALSRLPPKVYTRLTDRAYPVVFSLSYTQGRGRLAQSETFYPEPGDPPTFTGGFWLVKLSDELETVPDPSAVVAVIAHELAHRWLHERRAVVTPKVEKRINRLVRCWGFKKEFAAAKKMGQDPGDPERRDPTRAKSEGDGYGMQNSRQS